MNDTALSSGELGPVLRSHRIRRGMTLADLSARTGFPLSTLSKAENSKMSLTYDKLERICDGLGIGINALFVQEAAAAAPMLITGRRSVSRRGEGRAVDTGKYLDLYPATDLLTKGMIPVIVDIRARSLEEFGEFHKHSGEEYVYVLEGIVDFHSEIYAPLRLEAGDSLYFDSDVGHAWLAVSEGPCRTLSICLPRARF